MIVANVSRCETSVQNPAYKPTRSPLFHADRTLSYNVVGLKPTANRYHHQIFAMNHLDPNPTLTCSTCGRKFLVDESDSPPFCSQRCKLIDLGRWLDEEIGLPHEGGPEKGESIADPRPEAENH